MNMRQVGMISRIGIYLLLVNLMKKLLIICSVSLDNTNSHPLFIQVWNWKSSTCLCVVLWKIDHGSLLTNVVRAHRNMTSDDAHVLETTGISTSRKTTMLGWSGILILRMLVSTFNPYNWSTFFGVSLWAI
ncbi:hypothetical protein MtrunA17_Chr4g0073981 [Medicago truncatula]|uniref:Uncharacterized protein n=1 Tax=Medicago truncatula TaxID=3880 RepID=A0A396IJ50_MEDTR|nr:hypothetical protein MtrunA17_Chr4g0073981 [Medicago truncatula]